MDGGAYHFVTRVSGVNSGGGLLVQRICWTKRRYFAIMCHMYKTLLLLQLIIIAHLP